MSVVIGVGDTGALRVTAVVAVVGTEEEEEEEEEDDEGAGGAWNARDLPAPHTLSFFFGIVLLKVVSFDKLLDGTTVGAAGVVVGCLFDGCLPVAVEVLDCLRARAALNDDDDE